MPESVGKMKTELVVSFYCITKKRKKKKKKKKNEQFSLVDF